MGSRIASHISELADWSMIDDRTADAGSSEFCHPDMVIPRHMDQLDGIGGFGRPAPEDPRVSGMFRCS